MHISFTLNSPPFSINSAHYRNGNRTQKCRKWADKIFYQLLDPQVQAQLEAMRKTFDQTAHQFSVDLTFYIPSSKYFTKSGKISCNSMDLSNIEKLLIDLIFDKRFHGRKLGKEVISNLAIDDAYITELRSRKLPSSSYSIRVQITLSEL